VDSCALFECIRELPGAALLDSSYPHAISGRYDILTACPLPAGVPTLPPQADESRTQTYFSELARFHRDYYGDTQPASQDIPFCGGLLGYLGYESGLGLHKLTGKNDPDTTRPGPGQLQAYDWCVVQDHVLRRAVLVAGPRVPANQREDLLARLRQRPTARGRPFRLGGTFQSNMSAGQYRDAFDRVQAYIAAGDCYQVNLAQRFSAAFAGDPWIAYQTLRAIAAAPFSAFIDQGGDNAVLSLSPERFISLHGHRVETTPIKGTRPRHADSAADLQAADELRSSEKDRAENLMIVDLLRNDLGRSCVPGSIHVDRLFELRSFPTVHHLVSTISGELRDDRSAIDLLRDSFPGGSITGAPKRRAMEVIAELEPHSREVYCGSLLYISADGRMDSNIAIRTLVCNGGTVKCWGGGGIVADSRWEAEYQETFDKVGQFLGALETLLD
jgi:para-aminobenzoate synthetase component 1